MFFKFSASFLLLFFFVGCIFSTNILLKPTGNGPEIAIILLQGAEIPCDRYIPLASKIQSSLPNYKLWISIPNVFLQLPFDITASIAINNGLTDLKNAGFSSNSKIFIAGHSLGGMAAVEWGFANSNKIAGIIQFGSFLDRKYRDQQQLKAPVLMIGGELDGLSRITRFAEEYYNRILKFDLNTVTRTNPIVVLEGVNHMQFASGIPSSFVKERDLKAENSEDMSHNMISSVVANFISNNYGELAQQISQTGKLLTPIIQAFELEGSIHFNRPAQETCTKGYCGHGSDWAINAQEILAGKEYYAIENINLAITNDYVILSSLPPLGNIYHPKIDATNKENVKITTYSQCSWDLLDEYLDGGFSPSSAKEIGTKMLTRQCSFVFGLNHLKTSTPFSIDDNFDWCAEINKNALQWSVHNSAVKTIKRFNSYGQKLTFGSDMKETNGFSWVNTELEFKENSNNEMVVSAPVLVSDIDAPPVPIFAPDGGNCYHYCKLLSPARAIEWIYVDGLRKNYGLKK